MDWDYHARVKKVASIIHTKQWRTWRNIGIAYEFGNSTYSAPNRSLSTFAEGTTKSGTDRGIRKEFKGFWGDILVGPFNAFGVECDLKRDTHASDLFHIVNEGTGSEQHRHHTVEVALYNMIGYMWTVEVGRRELYIMDFAVLRICCMTPLINLFSLIDWREIRNEEGW
jgi:dynein assembly factor 3